MYHFLRETQCERPGHTFNSGQFKPRDLNGYFIHYTADLLIYKETIQGPESVSMEIVGFPGINTDFCVWSTAQNTPSTVEPTLPGLTP